MKLRRGKVIALAAGMLGMAVLVAAGVTFKTWLLEEYYLCWMQWGSDKQREAAGEYLGSIRSIKAIPYLVEAASRRARISVSTLVENIDDESGRLILDAVARVEVTALHSMLHDPDTKISLATAEALKKIQGEDQTP